MFHPIRVMPTIGGTGAFWLARGFVQAKTHFFNLTFGDAIVEYHVVVIHYLAILMESIFSFKGPHSACSIFLIGKGIHKQIEKAIQQRKERIRATTKTKHNLSG